MNQNQITNQIKTQRYLSMLGVIVVLGVVIIFTYLRLNHIRQSLLFFGDMGRDFLVLERWLVSGKPPLLGPQTSALPINQSAVYFYLLMPFYLLSGHSLFSTVVASLVIHLAGLFFLLWVSRHDRLLYKLVLVVYFLMAIHTQYVIQHRYVWNPSFVGLSLLTAYVMYRQSLRVKSKVHPIILGFGLAAAVSFSYSSFPAVVSLGMLSFYRLKNRLLLGLGFIGSLMCLNLPTLAFEIRHGFLLTKMMLFQDKLVQSGSDPFSKLTGLSHYVLNADTQIALTFVILLLCISLYALARFKDHHLLDSIILLTVTLLLTLIAPFSLHSHYIFGIVMYLFILIANLPITFSLLLLLFMVIQFLHPAQLQQYIQPAFRSTAESITCAKSVCSSIPQAAFVSVQASNHPYHDGKDFQYLFLREGCDVKDIALDQVSADTMLVVADAATYDHGKTAYHELTLFGPSQEIEVIECSPKLKIHVLKKSQT